MIAELVNERLRAAHQVLDVVCDEPDSLRYGHEILGLAEDNR